MTRYVALLRAVNVGGRKLLMKDLTIIAAELRLGNARTFIASGNLLFACAKPEATVKRALEQALEAHLGAAVAVMIRTADEIAKVAAANPFPDAPPNRVAVIFLDSAPAKDAAAQATSRADEEIALGRRELYVHYPSGMGQSKMRLPAAAEGTARNMNTVAKLAELAKEQA